MEINHDGVEVNLSNKRNTSGDSMYDANFVSFQLEESIHLTKSLGTQNKSENAINDGISTTQDQGRRIPYRTKSPPPPRTSFQREGGYSMQSSSSKSFHQDGIPLKSSSWSYPSSTYSTRDSDSPPPTLAHIGNKYPEFALSPTHFKNRITEDEFESTKRLFKLKMQQLRHNDQKGSHESNLHSGYPYKIDKPKPLVKSLSEGFILATPSDHTASNLSKAEEDLLVQTLEAGNDDVTKAEEDLLIPTLRSNDESKEKSNEPSTHNFVGALVDYMGGKVSEVSSVLDSLRVSEYNTRKENLSKHRDQNDHDNNNTDDVTSPQNLKTKPHESGNSNTSKRKSKSSDSKSLAECNDSSTKSNTSERSRSRSRSRLKSDGRTRVRRSKKIKSETKAKANAKRLHINCQKVNLTPHSEIEIRQIDKQDEDASDYHNKNTNNLNHLHEFCQTGDMSDQHLYDLNDTSYDYDLYTDNVSSSSIVTHEILRANWTWCTAWSPDGKQLALASENCSIAILDTTSKPVWKIIYYGPYTRPNKPFSVRALAWGKDYIAVGGTGDIVTILDGCSYKDINKTNFKPFRILHTIDDTGYVGSLDWNKHYPNLLAVGSRFDRFQLFHIESILTKAKEESRVECKIVAAVRREDWINALSFSYLGGLLAVGDKRGKATVYRIVKIDDEKMDVLPITHYIMEESILFISWSANGKWLFMGGEDNSVSVIDTKTWNVVNEICRDRWVFCSACSNTGTHIAVGGMYSKVDLFEINNWNRGKSIEFNGSVVLDAEWHPEDKYLSLVGQSNTVRVVDINQSYRINKECIHFFSDTLDLAISPDGKYMAVGKDDGIVSFINCMNMESQPEIIYEVVVAGGSNVDRLAIQWSVDSSLVAIGSKNLVTIFEASDISAKKSRFVNSRFTICAMIRDLGEVASISFSPNGKYMIIDGLGAKLFNVEENFKCDDSFQYDSIKCSSWSQDGAFLALIGKDKHLTIIDTHNKCCEQWRTVFDLYCDAEATALSWGPSTSDKLHYLAYGRKDNKVSVIEIRSKEECWEVVLDIPCLGIVLDMDWRSNGILAIGTSNGSANIVDLSYLLSGAAVNQMDYNWQRQGITCSILVQRKEGNNIFHSAHWLSSNVNENHVLILGGSDGLVESLEFSL